MNDQYFIDYPDDAEINVVSSYQIGIETSKWLFEEVHRIGEDTSGLRVQIPTETNPSWYQLNSIFTTVLNAVKCKDEYIPGVIKAGEATSSIHIYLEDVISEK